MESIGKLVLLFSLFAWMLVGITHLMEKTTLKHSKLGVMWKLAVTATRLRDILWRGLYAFILMFPVALIAAASSLALGFQAGSAWDIILNTVAIIVIFFLATIYHGWRKLKKVEKTTC